MRTVAPRVIAFLLLCLAGCPKRVVVNGQELSVQEADELARRELDRIRAETQGQPPAVRADRLAEFGARYPGVPSAAAALFEAGQAYRAARQPDRAAQVLGTLLTEHPLFERSNDAKYELALADIERGRARDGLATLESLYPYIPPERRPEAAARAAAAAEAAGANVEAIRWLGEVAALAQGDSRAAANQRMVEVVDRLSLAEVTRLRQSLPREAAVQEPLTMKLARIQLHLRDYPAAEAAAREVFLRWPTGAYAADAKQLVDRLGKLALVRPGVIGVAVPLSGPYQRWGEAILQGVGLALGENSGLKLVVRDTRGEPDGEAQAIEQLALDEGAIGIIGGVTNAGAERAAATAEDLMVPFISLSKQDGITAAGPFVFQNMLTASAQARALVDYAMGKRGLRRFAVMYPQNAYGTELANAFWDEVEARGGEIRGAESYTADRTTFTPLVKSMVGKADLDQRPDYLAQVKEIVEKEKDPFRRRKALEKARERLAPVTDFEAIFIPDFAQTVKLIAPALAVEDVITQTCLPDEVKRIARSTGRPDLAPVQLLGGNGWGARPTSPTEAALTDTSPGAPGRYVRCAVYVDGFFAGSARPATKGFVDAFTTKYAGKAPSILEASAFDAARMLKDNLGAQKAQTRDALRDRLAGLKAFAGATGDITMGPDRTPQKQLFYLTIDPAGLRELTPEELAVTAAAGP
ncbi:MAG: penicillin-binding protein activator [Anaeromyxobacter sp.]